MKAVMLSGGGIDSTTLLVYLRKKVLTETDDRLHILHVNYGQKAWAGEKQSIDFFAHKYDVPVKRIHMELWSLAQSCLLRGFPMARVEGDNLLEGRNCVLIALAGTYAAQIGASAVYVGFPGNQPNASLDPIPFLDQTWSATQVMQGVFSNCYHHARGTSDPILLRAPFVQRSKLEVLGMGVYGDIDILTRSYSCTEKGRRNWFRLFDAGKIRECGECLSCSKKRALIAELALAQHQQESK